MSATTFSTHLLNALSHFPFVYSTPFLLLFLCAVLPMRLLWVSVPTSIAILSALTFLNNLKISILSLPITYFDIKMVVSDPRALINALGLNDIGWLPYVGVGCALAISLAIGRFVVHRGHGERPSLWRRCFRHLPDIAAAL